MAGRIAAVVPAHNEEVVIASTLESLLEVFSIEDIYLANDASTDSTEEVARKYLENIYTAPVNVGKAVVINNCIQEFDLVEEYDFIVPVDADTRLAKDFGTRMVEAFDHQDGEGVVAIAGRVVGKASSWLTSYRLWEYELGQTIHKQAQSYINAISVCPGCSTVYRSEVFKSLEMPTGTLTEDMDMTFHIYRNRLGKIAFCSDAKVYTQDPDTMKELMRQLDRWYVGLWQNISKHDVPFGGQRFDYEVVLLASEGLLNGLFVCSMLVIVPLLAITNPTFLLLMSLAEIALFSLPSMAYVAIRYRSPRLLKYVFHFMFIRVISSVIFLLAFVKVFLGIDKRLTWKSPNRYKLLPNKNTWHNR